MTIEDNPVNKLDDHTILVMMYDQMDKMDLKYVQRTEFDPVKKMAYGLAGVVGLAVAGAVFKLIL